MKAALKGIFFFLKEVKKEKYILLINCLDPDEESLTTFCG